MRHIGGLIAVITLLFALHSGAAAQLPKKLSEEERLQLREQAVKLVAEARELSRQGKSVQAVERAEKALAIRYDLYPPGQYPNGHVNLASSLAVMGKVLLDQGDLARAKPYLEQALAMRSKLYTAKQYPDGHANLAESLADMATLCRRSTQLEQAQSYLEQALAVRQKLYPPAQFPNGHSSLARTLQDLGLLMESRGRYDQALPYHEQTLAMVQKLYPAAEHPDGHSAIATSLGLLGWVHRERGDYDRALPYLQESLAMRQKLYPPAKYPNGHGSLATGLNDLGLLHDKRGEYEQAQSLLEQAVAMRQKLYPAAQYPNGNAALAANLNNLGLVYQNQGEFSRAQQLIERSFAMRQKLYPREKYPNGHPALAMALSNISRLLWDRGDYSQSLAYAEQALAMRQKLYPEAEYPRGHPDVARSLNAVAGLFYEHAEVEKSLVFHERALMMRRKLYPPELYPDGHPELALSLVCLADRLRDARRYDQALDYYQQAHAIWQKRYSAGAFPDGHPDLASSFQKLGWVYLKQRQTELAQASLAQALSMRQKLYPVSRYPKGHLDLVHSFANLGRLCHGKGDLDRAQSNYEQALAMCRNLYPATQFPEGHPELVQSLRDLGLLFSQRGMFKPACELLEQAFVINERFLNRELAVVAEADAARLTREFQLLRDDFLSAARQATFPANALYARLWPTRSPLAQLLERRHQAILAARQQPELKARWDELTDVRRRLGRLFLNPPRTVTERDATARTLTERKEQLERSLAAVAPALAEQRQLDRLVPEDLRMLLPERSAFVDVFSYDFFEQDPARLGPKGRKWSYCYVAFVVTRAGVERVELGDCRTSDDALKTWLSAVNNQLTNPAAEVLRRRMWDPIAKHLPANTVTVYVAPDSILCRLPWAALPGNQPGTVLLETYAFAAVPSGRYLLARLREAKNKNVNKSSLAPTLLAVGGVRYDDRPASVRPTGDHVVLRDRSTEQWPYLPGTAVELQGLTSLPGVELHAVSGADASTERLVQNLPRSRYAHIATHGFFSSKEYANERKRQIQWLNKWEYSGDRPKELVGLGARNPLAYSGLVLAGANRAQEAGPDGGILSGEAILNLPLGKLDLVVLSACQTGRGVEADNECVRGLQLAFHVSGCKNVIASLWNVSDDATTALMAVFYDRLIREKKSPLEALREAQLTIYYHPERIKVLAGGERGSGPEFGKTLKRTVKVEPKEDGASRAPAKLWAGFVLSGLGR